MEEVLKKLDELEINYELVKHPPVYTIEDMTNLDPAIFKGAEICKNLFLRDQKGKRHFLVILCGDKQASMDKIQKQAYTTRLSFGSAERLQKHLKLEAGHVSPMGLINNPEKTVEVLLDKDLKNKDKLAFHPNTNEACVLITFADLKKFLDDCGHEVEYISI